MANLGLTLDPYQTARTSGGLNFANNPSLSNYSFGSNSPLNVNQAFNSGGLSSAPAVLPAYTAAPTATPNPIAKSSSLTTPAPSVDPQLASLNTQYDYLSSQGNQQLGALKDQYNQGINDANTNFQGLTSQVGQQKELAAQSRDKNIDQAASAAQNTQKQNRNTLRALGILNSSAAGELLTKPITEFGKVKAQFVQEYQNRTSQLDDFLNQKTSEHTNLLSQISNQYQQLVGNIQNDLRFNDRQRADAINAVNAALASKVQDIRTAQQTIKDKVNAQKLQLLQEAGQLESYKNPDFNFMDFTNNTLIPVSQGQEPKSVGLVDPRKQQGLSLDATQAFSSGGLAY